MDDWAVHNKIGDAMTRTPSASPDHHVSVALNHGSPFATELDVPPINPPTRGPAKQAPVMKATKSRRTRRSGGPPHNLSTSAAPTRGSITLDAANATESASGFPKMESTNNSAAMTAAAIAGQRARRLSIRAAAVTPAEG
jgi:hypothetical protein